MNYIFHQIKFDKVPSYLTYICLISRLLDLLMKKAKKHRLLRRKRRVMFNVLIPRPIHQEMIEEKKLPPKTIPRAAVLAINVVNFTHLSSDATPEELTSILNKLFERCRLLLISGTDTPLNNSKLWAQLTLRTLYSCKHLPNSYTRKRCLKRVIEFSHTSISRPLCKRLKR